MTSVLALDLPGAPETALLMTSLITAGVLLIPFILYMVTLQNTLKLIAQANRKMEPGLVWLLFIPIFGVIWHFMIVIRLSESIANEARSREIVLDSLEPGKQLGTAMCVLFVLSIIPVIGSITAIAGMVCWIIYWVRIAGYKRTLETATPVSQA